MMPIRLRWLRLLPGLALLALLLGHAAQYYRIELITRLDAVLYDTKLRLSAPGGQDPRIVIVDIDEKSLAEEGQWPWPRRRIAQLVEALFEQQHVRLLAFDVVFAEPDRSVDPDALQSLAQAHPALAEALPALQAQLDGDARLADALRGRPVVLSYYLSNGDRRIGALPEAVLPAGSFGSRPVAASDWRSYTGNLPALQAAAAAAGYFNPLVDFDGIYRRVPLLAEYQGDYYESLALAVVRTLLDFPPVFPGFAEGGEDYAGLEWLDLPGESQDLRLPVDRNIAALIPYRGGQGSFPYVSAGDLLHGRLADGALAGRIALLGTTAPGLMDLRATPVSAAYPGVEAHANLITGMLDGTLRHRPEYALGVDLSLLLAAGLMMIFIAPRLSALKASLFSLSIVLTLVLINLSFWQVGGLVMPLAGGLLLVFLLYLLNTTLSYFLESRSKRQLTTLFGQYVPPELVEQMSRDPQNYSMAGRKAELTVFFSDVRGFTSISERLAPEQLAALMNDYLGVMTAIIRRHHGTLDKYIGDAIMAFWGAPMAEPAHARQAVRAALAMQAALPALNEKLKDKGWPELAIGMGINTGWVTVGDMGSPVRQSYTVLGDAVNLASRLEGATKQYGVGLIVGENTRAQLGDEFLCREIDRVRVKGKTEAITLYEPLAPADEATDELRRELAQWNEVLQAWRARRWEQALVLLDALEIQTPRPLYAIYRERIKAFIDQAPEADWAGVTSLHSK